MKKEEDRFGVSVIKPTSFYSSEDEKIKLNWFCYELALGFEFKIKIREKLAKRLEKYGVDEEGVANFSIYLAKRMKKVILQKLLGLIEKPYISYKMIESYFPNLNDRLVNELLDAVWEAWDEQLSFCEICPTRCISERNAYCTMFDEGPYQMSKL